MVFEWSISLLSANFVKTTWQNMRCPSTCIDSFQCFLNYNAFKFTFLLIPRWFFKIKVTVPNKAHLRNFAKKRLLVWNCNYGKQSYDKCMEVVTQWINYFHEIKFHIVGNNFFVEGIMWALLPSTACNKAQLKKCLLSSFKCPLYSVKHEIDTVSYEMDSYWLIIAVRNKINVMKMCSH